MSTSKLVRTFLGFNAVFSALNGTLLLAMAGSMAAVIFATPPDWATTGLRILGIGLLIFALDLVLLSKNPFISKQQVILIVILDAGWVLGSILLLSIGRDLFSSTGSLLIAVVAGFVAIFAIGQSVGAAAIVPPKSRADVRSKNGVLTASVKRLVRAPASTVWNVMTDHPGYADVASNISKVEVLTGDGLGMQRQCYGPKGENWTETCDLFEPGKSFGFKIHT